MLKVLLVDDETLVRVGMKSIIPWKDNGFSIVDEAANGIQALDMVRKDRPDIILTDIMMPQMDGIELIKKVKEEKLGGKFIILSCVSEITYLQQAISLGVSRYVLKSSVKPEELLNMVNEIAEDIKRERFFDDTLGNEYNGLSQNVYLNEYLNLVLKAHIDDKQAINNKLRNYGIKTDDDIRLVIFKVVSRVQQETGKLNYPIAEICQSILDDTCGGYVFVNYEDYICMFIYCTGAGFEEKAVEEICFRIYETVKQCFDCEIITGMSEISSSFQNVVSSYREAKNKLDAAFFKNCSMDGYDYNIDSSRDLKMEKDKVMQISVNDSIEKIIGAVESIKSLVEKGVIISEVEVKKLYTAAIRYVMMTFDVKEEQLLLENNACQSLNQVMWSTKWFDDLHKLAVEIIQKCYDIFKNQNFGYYSDELIDAIIDYIKDNYRHKILLKDLSDKVHFSADYICKYFKKKTQQNLSDYILKYKIYQSKNMLAENKNIAKTAYDLGFSSDGHFSRTFKKYEGVTPGSYIKAQK